MAWRFALMIDPIAADENRTDFADTFSHARTAKKSELMALLTREERGQLE